MDNYLLNQVKEHGIVKIINYYLYDMTISENYNKVLNQLKEYHSKRRISYEFMLNEYQDNYYETFKCINHDKHITTTISNHNTWRVIDKYFHNEHVSISCRYNFYYEYFDFEIVMEMRPYLGIIREQ
jgi:hypothetical protein